MRPSRGPSFLDARPPRYLRAGGAGVVDGKEAPPDAVGGGSARTRRLLYVMNPNKFRACEHRAARK